MLLAFPMVLLMRWRQGIGLIRAGDPSSLLGSEMERYAARSAERFPFLAPERLKDAKGVRFGQPGYNPRTLMLPPNWFKTSKVLSDPLYPTPV